MKECLECGEMFEETQRISPWWKRQYSIMGVCADICNKCWKTEHNIDVSNK